MTSNPTEFLSRTGFRQVGAATSSVLSPGADINGVLFDGSANIVVTAAAGTLTGTTLNSTVLTSSLTTIGTIGTGVWHGTIIGTTYGGTGADSHASTGVAQVSAGTWSWSTALANGTTATTQAGGDNTTKVATTAFVTAAATGGTVTAVSIASANGITGSSSGGATPALTIVLGAITPTSVNSVVISGSSTPTLAVTGTTAVSGSNTGDQTITLTGDVTGSGTGSFGTTIKTNVGLAGSPTTTTQAALTSNTTIATTAYTDNAVNALGLALNPAISVQAATTTAANTSGLTYLNGVSGIGATFTGTTNTALVVDGYTFIATGQRLLVKNDTQSANPGAYNGVYYVTQLQTALLPPILTRALDYDQPSDINNTGAIPVINGTVNALTSWIETAQVVTVGTTPLIYTQFSYNPTTQLSNSLTSAYIFVGSAGNVATGVAMSGNVTISNSGVTTIGAGVVTNSMLAGSITAANLVGTDIATIGTITSGTWHGSVIGAVYGGTGIANNAASTITISGSYSTTLTVTGTTALTLPTAGQVMVSNTTGVTGGTLITNMMSMTAAAYALITPNSTTLYFING